MTYSKETLQGKYTLRNPEKYVGDPKSIVYRSSYELKFMNWCDDNPNILKWGSEEIIIPYLSPVDKKLHRYFVDFFIVVKTKSGEIKKYLIEIKPFRFTQKPVPSKRKSSRFIQEVMQYSVNQAKWEAATQFAKKVGAEFTILTEYDLGLVKRG